jgi:hypothetical protein
MRTDRATAIQPHSVRASRDSGNCSMIEVSRMRPMASLAAAAFLGAGLWGCGITPGGNSRVKPISATAAPAAAKPRPPEAPNSAFLHDASRMTANPAYPFARSWVDPSVDFTRYRAIVIAPVSLAYLRPVPAGVVANVDAHGRREAALKAAMRVPDAFEKAAAESGALKVTGNTGAGTVVASIAIVQLVPNLSAHDAGQPGAQLLLGSATTQMNKPIAVLPGEIAMETILRDSGSDKVIAMFADTQHAKIPPTATAPPSEYGFAGPAIGGWTKKIVRVVTSTVGIGGAAAGLR